MQSRDPRGRVPEPNQEPVWLPERPKNIIFGRHVRCHICKGKGKKRGNICGACGGYGVIDEGPGNHDPA